MAVSLKGFLMKKLLNEKLAQSLNNAMEESEERTLTFEKKLELVDRINGEAPAMNSEVELSIKESFTCPENEHKIIQIVIDKLLDKRIVINKSEVVRVGLHLLKNLSDDELFNIYKLIPKTKVGAHLKKK